MTGAGAVLALVLIQWTAGWVAVAAWSQSWKVIKRGHFRITAWITVVLGGLAVMSVRDVGAPDALGASTLATAVCAGLFLVAQYLRSDAAGVVSGTLTGIAGAAALSVAGTSVEGWNDPLAAVGLLAGAAFLGAVTNGMMLGHWYLNQPGLQPWALARLTDLGLATSVASAIAGLLAVGELATASTEGAILGIPGFGESFSTIFFGVWLTLLAFTGGVVWAARRCVRIRSIQSATGLFYVALLTAGVSEFTVRYLMVS